jgi:hypothetical protein
MNAVSERGREARSKANVGGPQAAGGVAHGMLLALHPGAWPAVRALGVLTWRFVVTVLLGYSPEYRDQTMRDATSHAVWLSVMGDHWEEPR